MLRHLSYRFKHSHNSHSIYNILTKSLLIDNSLKKDLELAQKRKLLQGKIIYKDANEGTNSIQIIEMSESHDIQPYIRNKNK
jgi:hypothetical protein